MLLLFFGELGALHAEVSEPDSLRVERIGGFDAEKLERSFGLVRFRSSAQARYALDLGEQFSKDLSRPNFNINNLRWIFDGKKIQAKDLQRLRKALEGITEVKQHASKLKLRESEFVDIILTQVFIVK